MPPCFLTLKEAAQVAGFSREALNKMADRGEVTSATGDSRPVRPGIPWRVSLDPRHAGPQGTGARR